MACKSFYYVRGDTTIDFVVLRRIEYIYQVLFHKTKKPITTVIGFLSSGGRTRTCDLWVMSPTSYLLLYPAIYIVVFYFNDLGLALRSGELDSLRRRANIQRFFSLFNQLNQNVKATYFLFILFHNFEPEWTP